MKQEKDPMTDIKKMYTTILGDSFPMEMTISFGDQTLVYRKRTWGIPMEDGTVDERGLRYGENPDQEAALYELVNGLSNPVTPWSAASLLTTCCRWANTRARLT